MLRKIKCNGTCYEKFYKDDLTFVTKTRKLCPACLKDREDAIKRKETARIEQEAIKEYKRKEAEKKRLKRLEKEEKRRKEKEEFEKLDSLERERIIIQENKLRKLISESFNIGFPTPMILKQIKNYRAKGFTLEGMYYAWEMIYNIKGKNGLDLKYGISLIPYYYEKAVENQELRNAKSKNIEQAAHNQKQKAVVVTNSKPNSYKNNILDRKKINMEDIL